MVSVWVLISEASKLLREERSARLPGGVVRRVSSRAHKRTRYADPRNPQRVRGTSLQRRVTGTRAASPVDPTCDEATAEEEEEVASRQDWRLGRAGASLRRGRSLDARVPQLSLGLERRRLAMVV